MPLYLILLILDNNGITLLHKFMDNNYLTLFLLESTKMVGIMLTIIETLMEGISLEIILKTKLSLRLKMPKHINYRLENGLYLNKEMIGLMLFHHLEEDNLLEFQNDNCFSNDFIKFNFQILSKNLNQKRSKQI